MKIENLKTEICIPKKSGGDYYVYIYDTTTKKLIQKFYKGINTDPDHEERLSAAQDLQIALDAKLKSGWIPKLPQALLKSIPIKEAFENAIKNIEGKFSPNTYAAYVGSARFFIQAIDSLKFNNLPSDKFTRAYAKKCLDWIANDREWSNNSYNKNLGYIRSVFAEIIECEHSEINPFREIKTLRVNKTTANIPPDDDEMKLICSYLKQHNYGLYVFYMMIYHCGLRPDEVRLLKIKQLDFKRKLLLLKASETKSKKFREVPMLGNIYDLLIHYNDFEPELFVFGTWVPNGGRHSAKNWFSPNKYSLKEDTPNRQWKKLIKDELGIDKNMYSAKHKGADDKRAAGIPIKTICDIFGHSETKMTERYMHSLKLERFEEARNVKMKDF